MSVIRVAGLTNDSIVDGPGFRYVVFTQGCPHNCPGCHNPQTHDFEGGFLKDTDEILSEMRKNPLLKGLTLSGGEPFEQAAKLVPFVKKVREYGYDVFAYSGYTFEELLGFADKDPAKTELLRLCDVLVDGRFVLGQRDLTLRFRGSSNQRVINVKASLEKGEVVLADI